MLRTLRKNVFTLRGRQAFKSLKGVKKISENVAATTR